MSKLPPKGAGIATWAISRPVTVCMFFLSMLMLGTISSQLLPLEKFPSIDIPQIGISIPYQDATPIEVEKMITKPVEEVLATMSGIKRLRSFSSEDGARVQLEFAWDANLKAKGIEAREKIDAIRASLPDDIERVLVYQFNTSDMPILAMRISAERDLSNEFELLNRELRLPIERIPGVSKVSLFGASHQHIAIRLDASRMASLQVNTGELRRALNRSNFSISAGELKDTDLQQTIRVSPQGQYRSIQDIRDLMIKQGVRLSDIASVERETPIRKDGRRLDQEPAIGLEVFRESNSNLVEVADRVMASIQATSAKSEFSGIHIRVTQNEADSVTQSLDDLLSAGMLGALLSFGVLYLFMRNIPSTLLVVLSVPFSIGITLGCMYLLGYTINILSMMGLMLAIGMLVDNAVVVTESIELERRTQPNVLFATQTGVSKVSLAVIAGTLTTAIVFLPNIVGAKVNVTIFLQHVAIAICISLFASLLISQTLIPLISYALAKRSQRNKTPEQLNVIPPRPLNKAQIFYQACVTWTLTHQGKASLIALVILVSTAIPFTSVTSDDNQNNDSNRIWINYRINGNYTLEEVAKSVDKIESYLYANQQKFHIKQVYSYYRSGFAVSSITFNDDLPVSLKVIRQQILESMPKLARGNPQYEKNNHASTSVRLRISGDSTATLAEIGSQIQPVLANVDGLMTAKVNTTRHKQELQISIDSKKTFRFGLTTQEVAQLVATALRGANLRTFRDQYSEVKIKLLFDQSTQDSIDALRNLSITRYQGRNITLDMLASFRIQPMPSQITRHSRQTSVYIDAELKEGVTLKQAKNRIAGVMQHIKLPDGYTWSFGSRIKRQSENESAMHVNMILALLMIYLVMAALFESLILPTAVITSLLFSITGVFWALYLTGMSMTTMALIGILVLMGIVVNNGIVLIDRINQLANTGLDLHKAIVQACLTRVKPILMTVATTILGLLPLALDPIKIGGDGPPYAPMAIAIIGGLIVSTVTSLLLVPLAYVLLLKLRDQTTTLFSHSKAIANKWV